MFEFIDLDAAIDTKQLIIMCYNLALLYFYYDILKFCLRQLSVWRSRLSKIVRK